MKMFTMPIKEATQVDKLSNNKTKFRVDILLKMPVDQEMKNKQNKIHLRTLMLIKENKNNNQVERLQLMSSLKMIKITINNKTKEMSKILTSCKIQITRLKNAKTNLNMILYFQTLIYLKRKTSLRQIIQDKVIVIMMKVEESLTQLISSMYSFFR